MTHRHRQDTWEDYPKVKCFEVGPTTCIRPMGRSGKPDGYIAAFLFSHDVQGQEFRCEGSVCVDPEIARTNENGQAVVWSMTGTIEGGNLTLAPSILCSTHPECHAYIQNGRWTG